MIPLIHPVDVLAAICLGAIAVPFVLYPLVLWAHARLAPNPVAGDSDTDWPHVDLLIAAHDEAASIGARLENALKLDYPADRLRIWVASDGSTDDTVEIANGFAERGVRVLDLPRGGKAAALVAAVEASASEDEGRGASDRATAPVSVLAFSDANSSWTKGSVRALVAPLADPQVGGVAGDQRYFVSEDAPDELHGGAIGERGYWSFDRALKRWQSTAGSAISATGAIYAIRRDLFEAPPPDATDDFMISTGVIAQGKRLVFSEDAVAFEPPADDDRGEFRRKVRIITRGLRAVGYRRALLDPRTTGFYAVELLLHKLWRRLTWIPLAALVLLAPISVALGTTFAPILVAVLVAVLLGGVGIVWPSTTRFRVIAVASYGVMVNAACAWATSNAIRGRRVARWDTERPTAPAQETLP